MIIIHAGMHKTGSSSIQETLYQRNGNGFDYLPWRDSNHSGLFFLMFCENPEQIQGFKQQGMAPETARKLADEWGGKVSEALEKRVADSAAHPAIFSAEVISSASEDEVRRLADYMRKFDPDIRAIAYVRPPVSFMTSAFQQRMKGKHVHNFKKLNLWPNYKERFEKLDHIFGRENVTLKLFKRNNLQGGDVVLDFAQEAGINLTSSDVVRTNEAMSLEAVALLDTVLRNSKLFAVDDKETARKFHGFLNHMMQIGSREFVLDETLTDPILAANRADLDWIEERLGMPALDATPQSDCKVSSEADLLAVATAMLPELEKTVTDILVSQPPTKQIVSYMGLLKDAL